MIGFLMDMRARLRAFIYRMLIVRMTSRWYLEVLKRVPSNAFILDVGIGEGKSLINNRDLLNKKTLRVHGIDYDNDYVQHCSAAIADNNLSSQVSVSYESVYDHKSPVKYDCVYFSGSFMILPEPEAALAHVCSLLKDKDSKVYFTQTIETKKSWLLEIIKPLLKYVLTIDFGHVTYENEFLSLLERCNMKVIEHESIGNTAAKITVVRRGA
jgi:2-polyprenyl-3-methyl-5-hydroxy-6-metoxy-1,4-benzoquinol methylase